MESQHAKISSVEDFGVFLDNGGFIHITDVSQHLGKRINSKNELEEVLPPGTEVSIELKEAVKGTRDEVRQVHFSLLGIEKDPEK